MIYAIVGMLKSVNIYISFLFICISITSFVIFIIK